MADFDYNKIKKMEYDPNRQRYVGKDGSEFKVTPYSDGTGYKYDYYDKSTYGNAKHNSTHVTSDLNEKWNRTDNNRDSGTQDKSSGCYLTTACMVHMQETFDDSCIELMTLRWFRDNFVSKDDIEHYYYVAPIIVNKINLEPNNNRIYELIYDFVIRPCVLAIQQKQYEFAYRRYKNSILALEKQFANDLQNRDFAKKLTIIKK